MTIFEKFWKRVEKTDGCWNWIGAVGQHGYGVFSVNSTPYLAHRFSGKLFFGDIDGKEIHHKCKNRRCVNPKHLQVVDPLRHPDSIMFLNTLKTHCPMGHPLEGANLLGYEKSIGKRACRECHRQQKAERYVHLGHRLAGPPLENKSKKSCKYGHPLSGRNLYVTPDGRRQCKICLKRRSSSRYSRRLHLVAPENVSL